MNHSNEEENNKVLQTLMAEDDQFPPHQSTSECCSNKFDSTKQTNTKNDRSKYQVTNRQTSLSPTRHLSCFNNENVTDDIKIRRRYASDSTTIDNDNTTSSLVTSFLQNLRHELRATTNNPKTDYHRRAKQVLLKSRNSNQPHKMNSKITNEQLLELNDNNEILTLIDLLVLRVECLTNEKRSRRKTKTKEQYPTVAEVDQNLIEYLYYLFTKFANDDTNSSNDLTTPTLDKNNFVNICQALVRNGCFDIPSTTVSTISDQSYSDETNSSDQTLTPQTFVHEYYQDTNKIETDVLSTDGRNSSNTSSEQDAWLVINLQNNETSERSCRLLSPTLDEHLLANHDNYKSCDSESSQSVYFSPNSSLIDIQNMVQEFDENSNLSNTLTNEDESLSNVTNESKTITSNDLLNNNTQISSATNNNICTGLSNDKNSVENSEQIIMNNIDKMSQREKKMQERWSTSITNDNEQSSKQALLGVEFPQISVLRRKFSSSTPNKSRFDSKTTPEINTSTMTITVKQMNPDQTAELPSKDISLLITNDDGQAPITTSEAVCLSDDEKTMKKKQDIIIQPKQYEKEIITNLKNDLFDNRKTQNENSSIMRTNLNESISSFSSSSPSRIISISPSSTLTTNEKKATESLPKEKEKEKNEEQRCDDNYNADEEKKNNSSFVHDYHASGIILINDEPTQTALLQQEKKEKEEGEGERPSSPLLTLEQLNQQRTEDESPLQNISNNLNQKATNNKMSETDQRYNKIEIEEVPDDEETISKQNKDSIEPIDFIRTDDEPKKPTKTSTKSTTILKPDDPMKFENVLSCYEKAFAKIVDTYDESPQSPNKLLKEPSTTTQQSGNDPIALRALQRFEERMNAAAAKTNKEDINSLAAKGKSSWSGTLSAPRKSIENLFKADEQQFRSTPVSTGEELSTIQTDTYIRPRRTFDDNSVPYGTTLNLFNAKISTNDKSNNKDHKLEEQQQPSVTTVHDDKRVVDNKATSVIDSKDQEKEEQHSKHNINNTIMMNENDIINSSVIEVISTDNSRRNNPLDTNISQTTSTEQSTLTPYRFQLEGRRPLNTLERMRERRKSRESLDTNDQQQVQLQNEYSIKSEDVQDPIIRRALERFDEKSRTLTQTKSINYDEIQDPITRRALMRLESNLKRTNPSTSQPTNETNENWYTESYTLGTLQPATDRPSRYTENLQTSALNTRGKQNVSLNQRYIVPQPNDHETSVAHVPSQPIYVTSNNQQSISTRQRSRSEDMLSSRDFSIGQTTNLDDIDTSSSQLQRNRSSNQIALNEPALHLHNALIKSLEPNFVRTTESSVSYATPTQTYSAYSCEYTRPRRNLTSNAQDAIQSPTTVAPTRSPATTITSNYYGQQPSLTPSYNSMYSSNNVSQTSYSEDPIIRRALERFNSQMQQSNLTTSQYQSGNNYFTRQGSYPESYISSNRPSLMTTSVTSIGNNNNNNNNNSGGYQSIIGRRRQTRYDDSNQYLADNTNMGDGYESSVFVNPYTVTSHYANMPDQPPAIPPRFRRENYRNDDMNDHYRRHSTDEYLSDNYNYNNNNNNTLPRDTYIHHAYPATITNATGFRPINIQYTQTSYDQDELRDHPQSPTSTNSSDSVKQQQRSNHIRTQITNQQPLISTKIITRSNEQLLSNKLSTENGQTLTDQTTNNNGGDSNFHRLAYTGTKTSLSKTSSNSCSNLLNKNGQQIPVNQLKSTEIDFDNTRTNENENENENENDEQNLTTTTTNKYQRSKSVDTRTRLKYSQGRSNNYNQLLTDNDDNQTLINDEQQKTNSSSKFTHVNTRQDSMGHSTTNFQRRRPSSGNNISSTKNLNNNLIRRQASNGNLIDNDNQQQEIEIDENLFNDNNYHAKIIDNKNRTNLPVHRYATNINNIQSSQSTSSMNGTNFRTKPPVTTQINVDRRDSNGSITDINRTTKRSDENRIVSPSGQRRNIPVSVFAPAKLDNKRPAPVPPTFNYESQQQTSYPPRLLTNEQEINNKTNSGHKSSTGNLINEFSSTTDRHDKKMNVFERLFRSNKKKT